MLVVGFSAFPRRVVQSQVHLIERQHLLRGLRVRIFVHLREGLKAVFPWSWNPLVGELFKGNEKQTRRNL